MPIKKKAEQLNIKRNGASVTLSFEGEAIRVDIDADGNLSVFPSGDGARPEFLFVATDPDRARRIGVLLQGAESIARQFPKSFS